MEPSSRPRHQIRAQGRRRGGAGIVILKNDTSRLRWHPGGSEPVSTGVIVAARPESKSQKSNELLDFISRTAVQSEKELLSDLEENLSDTRVETDESSGSLSEFRRIIANVQKNERSAFRQIRTTVKVSGDGVSPEGAVFVPIHATEASNLENPANLLHQADVINPGTPLLPLPGATEGDKSGLALRCLLKELNDWLSDGVSPLHSQNLAPAPSLHHAFEPHQNTETLRDTEALRENFPVEVDQSQIVTARMPAFNEAQIQTQRRFGFEQKRDWNYGTATKPDQSGQPQVVRSKLSPLLEAARRMTVNVKNLPLGRRIESHENGAILEKDELGRVTQIRAQSGEIISVYYGKDGAPEGFVRTDARGVLHSVAECDSQGVVLRDENGRVRAAGDSIAIDPLGRISICRSDGQYWSIDLARQMLSEKRRLADPTGKWTALTAVFAADGFRMMTLFQKLTPPVEKSSVRSQDDANRVWSRAAVASGHFRFYGRDGSTIEFNSEEGLVALMPTHVSSPGVRPIEPRWQARFQAGTAWQSVHEYVVSYLAV